MDDLKAPMPTAAEKLANSLDALHKLQSNGKAIIRSADIARSHRERLVKNGFLKRIINGWYIPSRPDEAAGESTAWYASFWKFCSVYLNFRFGDEWCISPEHSLLLQTGNQSIPPQLLVRSPKATRNITSLPFETSLLDVQVDLPNANEVEEKDGLRVYTIPAALVSCSPGFYTSYSSEARAALGAIRNASEILPALLDGGRSIVAGRLAGAFRNIGKSKIADEILKAMRAADYNVNESDPFNAPSPLILKERVKSPSINRLRLMWEAMRGDLVGNLPPPPGAPNDIEAYLKSVNDGYITDAYHSLSIEGYHVTEKLIDQVRSGNWSPDTDTKDASQRDALAARGYWQAYQSVQVTLEAILNGRNPGEAVADQHGDWYRELFAPSVTAGIIKPGDLAGYRNGSVYIRQSMHIPPKHQDVLDLMETFFELLTNEPDPAVRVVLGHFVFVYIHPYIDGNGRISRFLMNTMLAAAGYPWTVIPVEQRHTYMSALESASVSQDIRPFAQFIGKLLETQKSPS